MRQRGPALAGCRRTGSRSRIASQNRQVRLLRPILTALAIVPLFLKKFTAAGAGLAVELADAAAGL